MCASSIYSQHDAAFARFSSFVILSKGKHIATVSMKFPADGAGRLYAYCHILGTQMVRGSASGYGYDKRSAAVEAAFDKMELNGCSVDIAQDMAAMKGILAQDSGYSWAHRIESLGYTVIQAV